MTEQIYYNCWGTQNKEHKDYFYTIGTIADWIGYALIGPRHRSYSTDIIPLSNICVLQTKEKFGTPRVYVAFSEETEMEDIQHYRHVYKTAIKLFPQYEKAIVDGMDYPEYLFNTEEEIEAFIDDKKDWLHQSKAKGYFEIQYYAEKLEKLDEEKLFLKKVCLSA